MSKTIGKVFGTGSTGAYGYEKNYMNYLKNYDTYNYDNTLNNMSSMAYSMSNNLSALPNIQYTVENGDDARIRAENATYQSYIDKLTPVYQQQTSDLSNSLINQGIPVGSEAYNRAMQNLQNNQNAALNQAAYNSVLNGQNAYSMALADNLQVAQFNNDARQQYINQIQSLLSNSVSGYDNAANLYGAQSDIQTRRNNAKATAWNNFNNTVGAATKAAVGAYTGGFGAGLMSGLK